MATPGIRVALFFDGKNFYSGWKEVAASRPLDFSELARWLVDRVGGSILGGAHYYTGIEPDAPRGSHKLAPFLDALERQPGFFVKRFPRKKRTTRCTSCGVVSHYTEEKEVDTTMVADMLRWAAQGAFDIGVLLSGDADLAPAIEGLRALGRQGYVATWGGLGLSVRLREAAFDHIDLASCLAELASPPAAGSAASEPTAPPAAERANEDSVRAERDGDRFFLEELAKAEHQFEAGYVGVHYFVTKWHSDRLDPSPVARRRIMARLEEAGQIEVYETQGGDKAVRRSGG